MHPPVQFAFMLVGSLQDLQAAGIDCLLGEDSNPLSALLMTRLQHCLADPMIFKFLRTWQPLADSHAALPGGLW